MRPRSKAIDATRPLSFTVMQCHWDKAKPFSNEYCAMALALKDRFDDCRVNANIVQVRKGDQWYRYMAGAAARIVAALIDKGNRARTQLPESGIRIVLNAIKPGSVRSLDYLRSPEMAAKRKESEQRRKNQTRRVYTRTDSISLQEIRHGRGAWV